MTSSQITDSKHFPSGTYLTETELAARWQVARGSLANLRSAGRAPLPWTRVLGRVRYDLADVVAYERAGRQVA